MYKMGRACELLRSRPREAVNATPPSLRTARRGPVRRIAWARAMTRIADAPDGLIQRVVAEVSRAPRAAALRPDDARRRRPCARAGSAFRVVMYGTYSKYVRSSVVTSRLYVSCMYAVSMCTTCSRRAAPSTRRSRWMHATRAARASRCPTRQSYGTENKSNMVSMVTCA